MAKQTECTDMWAVVQVMEVSDVLKGKSFSVTGHVGIPRKELIRIIETAGGQFNDRPKWGTTYLVTNRAFNEGSTIEKGKSTKIMEAERNGIRVISEKQFCNLVLAGTHEDKTEFRS